MARSDREILQALAALIDEWRAGQRAEEETEFDRYGKRIPYPKWWRAVLEEFRDDPRVEVYLGRTKVYWRPRGNGLNAEVLTDPEVVRNYCASLERPSRK